MQGERVFALDLPGHGRSTAPLPESIEGHVERLGEWMSQLGLGPAILVGHSMGGAIALQAALLLPGVGGLALVASGGRLRVDPALLEGLSRGDRYHQTLRDLNRRWFAPQAEASLIRRSEQQLLEAPQGLLAADLRACDRFDVLERLSEVSVPTLVVCGLLDQMIPEKYCRTLAYRIPRTHLEFVPEAGHMLMLEQPEAVAGAVRRFLETEFPC